MSNKPRVVFMGTPDFAAVSLRKLLDGGYDVAAVYCQPDKASGRGMKITDSPVKALALKEGIPVYQPSKLRDGAVYDQITALAPDFLVVVAYGRIIPDELLSLPKIAAVNVHGSLLPKYRGAAPIQWAVLNGDRETGVTTMHLAHDMDAGDTIYQEKTKIGEEETSGELFDRLAVMGGDLLVRTLQDLEKGTAPRIPQNNEEASYVTMIDKTLCPIDFSKSSREVVKHICGLLPWPVATATLGGKELKIFSAVPGDGETDALPGTVVSKGKDGIAVACGDGKTVVIKEVQAPGKRRMSAADYLLGHPEL